LPVERLDGRHEVASPCADAVSDLNSHAVCP
jgi:hypothetical protein